MSLLAKNIDPDAVNRPSNSDEILVEDNAVQVPPLATSSTYFLVAACIFAVGVGTKMIPVTFTAPENVLTP